MKIEIDSSRPDELRKLRREHEFALQMIDAALAAIGKNGVDPKQPQLIRAGAESIENPATASAAILLSDSPIAGIVERMENEFTMSDIFDAAESGGITRSRARQSVADLIEKKYLICIEPGSGRRPSKFRKA